MERGPEGRLLETVERAPPEEARGSDRARAMASEPPRAEATETGGNSKSKIFVTLAEQDVSLADPS